MSKIIDKTVLNTHDTKISLQSYSSIELEISKMVSHRVLNHLFILASSNKTHDEVNAITYSILKNIKKVLEKKELSDYHSHYMSDKIQKFFSGNLEVEVLKELQPPDGSPIGSNDLYLFKCGSEL